MSLFGPPNIEKLKAKQDVKGLVKALRYQKDAEIRKAAAYALGQIREGQAVEKLQIALQDGESDVRVAAAHALGKIGDVRAVDALAIVLNKYGESNYVKESAANALGHMGGAKAVEALRATLERNSCPPPIVADVLAQIGDVPAIEALRGALINRDYHVRTAAATALGQIKNSQVAEILVVALGNKDLNKYSILNMLIKMGTLAVEPLMRAMKDERPNIQAIAALALVKIGDIRAIGPLTELFRDNTYYLDEDLLSALRQVGDGRVVRPLITLARNNPDLSKIAISTLKSVLARNSESASLDDLKAAANLESITESVSIGAERIEDRDGMVYYGATKYENRTIDCSGIRNLARQELLRRGYNID